MVILAIGVRPDTSLAKDAGLALGAGGSIIVNSRMETSIPDIYAAGDAVQIRHRVTGKIPGSHWPVPPISREGLRLTISAAATAIMKEPRVLLSLKSLI